MDSPEKLATQGTQYEEKYNTIYVGQRYAQTNTNNVNKIWALLQTTGDKDESNIAVCGYRNGYQKKEPRPQRHNKLKRWATRIPQKSRVKSGAREG